LPVDALMRSGLGLLPLAPLSDEAVVQLPAVIAEINQRIERETADPQTKATLWTTTDILMGLRYDRELIDHMLQKVLAMKESVTYQAIVAEGELKAARTILLRTGRKKFGSPDAATLKALE